MLIYQIPVIPVFQNSNSQYWDVQNSDPIFVPALDRHVFPDCECEVDYQYMQFKYNFTLTKAEIKCFEHHRKAWRMFFQSNHKSCLIIENNAALLRPLSELIDEFNEVLEEDWDVIFPFCKSHQKKSEISINDFIKYTEPYTLGFYWGSYAYFLSKKGLNKLLSISIIKQPLDDEFLELSRNGQLDIFEMSQQFVGKPDAQDDVISIERESTIKEAILNINIWTQTDQDELAKILSVLSDAASQANLDLVLDSGTLLGYIRHGGIMGWDDDVDLAIDEVLLESFLSETAKIKGLNCAKLIWGVTKCIYYKFWLSSGLCISNKDYKFPFVDVWLYRFIKGDQIEFDDGRIFPYAIYNPLQNAILQGFKFKIPLLSQECLTLQYPDWKEKVQIYPWSHRVEQFAFFPLRTSIEVDQFGRIV